MKEVYIVIKEFNNNLAKRQPWYTIKALENLLIEHNIQVHIIPTIDYIDEGYTGIVIKVWSLKDLLSFKLQKYKLNYLITFPFYPLKKFFSLNKHDLIDNWKGLYKLILTSIIPKFVIKKSLQRAEKVIVISDRSNNYLSEIVETIKFIPFINDNWNGKLYQKNIKSNKKKTIGYFGPPISTRGFLDVLDFYKYSIETENNYRLKLITRIERTDLKELESKYTKTLEEDKNVTIVSGFLERDALATELQDIDMLILPFKVVLSELPIVAFEALEFGIGLISTEDSGIENIGSLNQDKNILFVNDFSSKVYPEVADFINQDKDSVDFSIVQNYLKLNNMDLISTLEKLCQK